MILHTFAQAYNPSSENRLSQDRKKSRISRGVSMFEIMQEVITPVTMLMLLLLIGLILGRAGIFGREFNRGLSFFLLKLTLPCLIIISMQRPFTPELANAGFITLGVSLGLYTLISLASFPLVRIFSDLPERKNIYQFVLIFSNVGFMGFPLMESLWGRESIFLGAIFNAFFNFFVFSVGILILRQGKSCQERPWVEVISNPGIWATLVGFLLFLFSIKLPSPVFKTLDMIGGLTTPLSMILIGSALALSSIRESWKNLNLWLLALVRLLLLPLAVWGLMVLFQVPRDVSRVAILLTAMPAAANTTLLAHEYTEHPGLASQSVLVTTSLAFLTIPFLVVLLQLGK